MATNQTANFTDPSASAAVQHAYDYDKQTWITGPAAVTLRIKQVQDDLDILTGPKGDEYCRFVNIPDKADKIKQARRELELLQEIESAA